MDKTVVEIIHLSPQTYITNVDQYDLIYFCGFVQKKESYSCGNYLNF